MQLNIETFSEGFGSRCMKITGLTEEELHELDHMDYRDMKKKIIAMLDERNDRLGTQWSCGYGLYTAWIRNGALFVEIGNSCD